jgi:LuxR family maltose regulon positive regulatory protein
VPLFIAQKNLTSQMLLTKLHLPSPGNNLIQRTHLFDQLNEGLSRKLILISAPAGFGKTTLISDWVHRQKVPVAWFSLDKSDNDPVNFLSYIISGIQSINEEFGQSAIKLLKSPNKPNLDSILSLIINDILQINDNFLLVLDDFHVINNSEVSEVVHFLLDHNPDNIHLLISTRSDPALPLARLRSQHQLVELRSSDLCFSTNEIYTLFNKRLKIKLSVDDAQSLETKTEGWIAGLQLLVLSMSDQESISEFISTVKADNRYIMDYLMEEVLRIQSDDLKEFLLQTAILEQMSAPLCNQVLKRNDSQLILEKLEKSGMFLVPLDRDRQWYRYHHLFADLLKQRLLTRNISYIEDLHTSAGKWFEDNKMYELALEHVMSIKDYEKSIQILSETVESMWHDGKHSAIIKYGDSLPDEIIKTNPEFCLYYSLILIGAGETQKARPFLQSAEKNVLKQIQSKNSSSNTLAYYKKFLGKISVAFASLSSHEEPGIKTLSYCEAALEYLTEDDSLWLSWAGYFLGNENLAQGNIPEGMNALNRALHYSKLSGNLYLMTGTTSSLAMHKMGMGQYNAAYKLCTDLLVLMNRRGYSQIAKLEWTFAGLFSLMSVIQCTWTDFEKALENAKIGFESSKNVKNIYQKIATLFAYSFVLYAIDDKKGSADKCAEIEGVLKQNKLSPFLITMYVGWKIHLLVDSEKLDEANQFAEENGLGLHKKISYHNEHSYIHYTRLMLANYRLNDAELILSQLYPLATAGKRVETLVQLKIISAIICEKQNKHGDAVTYMVEAMELAADENLLIYFLFDIHTTMDLLKDVFKIHATKNTQIPKKFIDKLKVAIEKKEKMKKVQAEGELSKRELETLKLMAENLTNLEIADKMFISLNTVKTHVKNILLKLEAENRANAVVRAKEQQII